MTVGATNPVGTVTRKYPVGGNGFAGRFAHAKYHDPAVAKTIQKIA